MRILEERARKLRNLMDSGRGGGDISPSTVSLEPLLKSTTSSSEAVRVVSTPSEFSFVAVRPSAKDEYTAALSEQLLLGMGIKDVLSFEIIGLPGNSMIQIAGSSFDLETVMHQVMAVYRKAEVVPADDLLGAESEHLSVVRSYRLRDSYLFQIRTSYATEPYTTLLGIFAGLTENERAVFQVLFAPVRQNWRSSILASSRDRWDPHRSPFIDIPDLPRIASRKMDKPLFAVAVRIAASSDELISKIERSFLSQYDGADNGLVAVPGPYPVTSIINRVTHGHGMILNLEEVSGLIHIPNPNGIPSVLQRASITAPPPTLATENMLVPLGMNQHGGRDTTVGIPAGWMTHHSLLLGGTGYGKSTTITHIVSALAAAGHGLVFIDPHGDTAQMCLDRIPESRINDTLYLNAADLSYPVSLNVFAVSGDRERHMLAADLHGIFEQLFKEFWGPQMGWILRQSLVTLISSRTQKTLADLPRLLSDDGYRSRVLSEVDDADILRFWQSDFPRLPKGAVTPILNKVSSFIDDPVLRNILCQQDSLDLKQVIEEGKIAIFNLSKGVIGDAGSTLLGSYILSAARGCVMGRAHQDSKRDHFAIIVDEFSNYGGHSSSTYSVESLFTESRKYNVSFTVATQYLAQLKQEIGKAILGSVGTLIVMRCGISDARLLEPEMGEFTYTDLMNLSIGKAVVRMGAASSAFNVSMPPLDPPARSFRDEIIRLSRERYCRPRDVVEQELRVRSLPVMPVNEQIAEPKITPAISQDVKEGDAEPLLSEREEVRQHRYLQNLIKQMSEGCSFRAVIEKPTPDGLGRVDVALERDDLKIACEISVTTNSEHELSNIEKCLKAGYDKVILCSPERKTLDKVRALVSAKLDETYNEKVLFLKPEDVLSYLEEQAASGAGGEDRVKGYKVKVKYRAVEEAEKKAKREAVAQVILQALGRIRKKK